MLLDEQLAQLRSRNISNLTLGPPGAPINVRIADRTPTAVTISWDAPPSDGSSDAAQYYVDLKEEQEFDYTPVGRVDGRINRFTTEFLRKGKLYRFRVRARNSAGFSEPGEILEPISLLEVAGKFAHPFSIT